MMTYKQSYKNKCKNSFSKNKGHLKVKEYSWLQAKKLSLKNIILHLCDS